MSKKNPPIKAKEAANFLWRKREEKNKKAKTKFRGKENIGGELVWSRIKNKRIKIRRISFFI
jgi:stalled ribosome alternative rescue factor ArfA